MRQISLCFIVVLLAFLAFNFEPTALAQPVPIHSTAPAPHTGARTRPDVIVTQAPTTAEISHKLFLPFVARPLIPGSAGPAPFTVITSWPSSFGASTPWEAIDGAYRCSDRMWTVSVISGWAGWTSQYLKFAKAGLAIPDGARITRLVIGIPFSWIGHYGQEGDIAAITFSVLQNDVVVGSKSVTVQQEGEDMLTYTLFPNGAASAHIEDFAVQVYAVAFHTAIIAIDCAQVTAYYE